MVTENMQILDDWLSCLGILSDAQPPNAMCQVIASQIRHIPGQLCNFPYFSKW